MPNIIVNCEGFPLEYTAYQVDKNTGKVIDIVRISANTLIDYLSSSSFDYVGLSGPEEYCLGLKQMIEEKIMAEYANKNIEIEVLK